MDALAELAERYSFGMLRVTHNQNLVLADVPQRASRAVARRSRQLGSRRRTSARSTDMICCPGLDFCSLANAGSIPVAKQIHEHFDDFDYLYELGPIEVKMSGCMNACGHHHVGHIGILGVDKHGEEWYQITLGGSRPAAGCAGEVIGPSVPQGRRWRRHIATILDVYVRAARQRGRSLLDTVRRIGVEPFQERVYATDHYGGAKLVDDSWPLPGRGRVAWHRRVAAAGAVPGGLAAQRAAPPGAGRVLAPADEVEAAGAASAGRSS